MRNSGNEITAVRDKRAGIDVERTTVECYEFCPQWGSCGQDSCKGLARPLVAQPTQWSVR